MRFGISGDEKSQASRGKVKASHAWIPRDSLEFNGEFTTMFLRDGKKIGYTILMIYPLSSPHTPKKKEPW